MDEEPTGRLSVYGLSGRGRFGFENGRVAWLECADSTIRSHQAARHAIDITSLSFQESMGICRAPPGARDRIVRAIQNNGNAVNAGSTECFGDPDG